MDTRYRDDEDIELDPVHTTTQPIMSIQKQRRWLPPILAPRLSWKYVLCSIIAAYVLYCFLFSKPFFSSNLPMYSGPYQVGAIDLEIPLDQPRIIHGATFKDSGKPAFEHETTLFTIYYPAKDNARAKKANHYWIPKPLSLTAEGYARFAHIDNFFTNTLFTAAMGLMVGGRTIPAKVDVPLYKEVTQTENLKRTERLGGNPDGFPVMVFSHGMASSRTDYTHYCGELASRGYIVAAIEHRDGSCPGTTIMKKGSPDRPLLHFGYDDVQASSQESGTFDNAAFRQAQLAFREAEIAHTAQILIRINQGDGAAVHQANSRDNEGSDLHSWTAQLHTSRMLVGGHSFGATGALQALKAGPDSVDLPFHGAIVLDPGKSSGPLNSEVTVPILVIHSNSWSKSRSVFYGRPHFEVVRELVENTAKRTRERASWFLTSLGTSHPSVTDAPLIEPTLLSWTTGATIDVYEGLRQYVHVSEDFLHFIMTGDRRNLLKLGQDAVSPEYADNNDKMPQQWRKYWQLHVAP